MTSIKKIAVLGSGVMGSAIAAQAANAGYEVVLLDMVPKDAKNRNMLAEAGVQKQLESKPPGFTHKRNAKRITCGNYEDDLDLLKDCDWIIEAVKEDLTIKQNIYNKVDAVRKPGSIVSSNTSTLPLHMLTSGMPESFTQDFMITHFFNPPRFMSLLEIVPGGTTRTDAVDAVSDFADKALGKSIVTCKDTPGFIANRIGVYWMMQGLQEAMKRGLTVEQADAVMGVPAGMPKTSIFGLFDLVGIDLMPLAAKSMVTALPEKDVFRKTYNEPLLLTKMIAEGNTGRKGKGGFYRLKKLGDRKIKEVIDLKTGEYHPESRPAPMESVAAAKGGLRALLEHGDEGGQYAWAVLSNTLCYAASLVPEISDNISAVDEAMRKGYNWKSGPFEMIGKLGVDWFCDKLKAEGRDVPPILEQARGKKLYVVENGMRKAFSMDGSYVPVAQPEGVLTLADIKLHSQPIIKNASAALWDMGDGIVCLELTSKANALDADTLSMIEQTIPLVQKDFKGLVIGGDAENFSVGANLGLIKTAAKAQAWDQISAIIKRGQNAMMALKYAAFPVVAAPSGMTLGGGCELLLHSDAVQAHTETYAGLVEAGVGLVPGWGGCTQMLMRHVAVNQTQKLEGWFASEGRTVAAIRDISTVFQSIANGKFSGSAEEARDMKILREGDGISMNRSRILADAKARCAEMVKDYTPPVPQKIYLPGRTARMALNTMVDGLSWVGRVNSHDVVVSKALANVLSGGNTSTGKALGESDLLKLEHDNFMELVKTPATMARIEHMLETGKPLRESNSTRSNRSAGQSR